jgi:hypothetical protein
MTQRRALSGLIAAFLLVASTRSARAQDALAAAMPADGPQTPGVEPLRTTALPVAASPAQTPPLWPAQPAMVHERYLWLVGPGGFVFLLGYGAAFLVGTLGLLTPAPDNNPTSSDIGCDSTCKKESAYLMIPVAGPLLASAGGPHNANDIKVGLWWSGIQAVSLAVTIVGLIGHDVPLPPLSPGSPAGKVSIVPLVTSDGGALSLRTIF